MKKVIEAKNHSVMEIQRLITSGIGPRPIALVSTISKDGIANLAPFSFFNAFSGNPPILVFSPARRGRDGTLKDTYHNIKETMECVVGVVSESMVEQVSLASSEYGSDVDEFIKSGLTAVKADEVKSPGIDESPLWMECTVRQVLEISELPGSGNLVVAEVLKFHVDENILNGFVIDPDQLRAVGRFGENYYVKAFEQALFRVDKPVGQGIGIDQLPDFIKNSTTYTGNDLGRLANIEAIPDFSEVDSFKQKLEIGQDLDEIHQELRQVLTSPSIQQIEQIAQKFLKAGLFKEAWYTALLADSY